MRLVTLGAGDAFVEILVGVSRLMAAATGSRSLAGVVARGVRIVATDTSASYALLGVVRVNAGMTARAGLLRGPAHVVGRVTAGALVVRGHTGVRQHMDVRVA